MCVLSSNELEDLSKSGQAFKTSHKVRLLSQRLMNCHAGLVALGIYEGDDLGLVCSSSRTLSGQTSGYCVMQPLSRSSSNVSSCCSGVRENETSEEEENEAVSVGSWKSPFHSSSPPVPAEQLPHPLRPVPHFSCAGVDVFP